MNEQKIKFVKKTVEKSKLSASFFCTSAFPKPLSTNTCKIVVITVMSATVPYAFGSNILARTMDTIKATTCAPTRSANRHIKFDITPCFEIIISPTFLRKQMFLSCHTFSFQDTGILFSLLSFSYLVSWT